MGQTPCAAVHLRWVVGGPVPPPICSIQQHDQVIETALLIVQMPLGLALIAWLAAAPAHSMGCPAPTEQDIQRLQAGERVVLQGDDCLIDIQIEPGSPIR